MFTVMREIWGPIVVFSLAVVIVGLAEVRSQEPQPVEGGGDPLLAIELAARAARNNKPEAVGQFVDAIVQGSLLRSAPPSVVDRLTRCELAFRAGQQRPIDAGLLVQVANAEVQRLQLPPHFRTTLGQLRLYREQARFFVRSYATVASASPDALSPAEALHLIVDLAQQKNGNEWFFLEPEAWEQRALAHRAAMSRQVASTAEVKTFARLAPLPAWAIRMPAIIAEDSSPAQAIHGWLDAAGFSR